jgi:hypothetical protein
MPHQPPALRRLSLAAKVASADAAPGLHQFPMWIILGAVAALLVAGTFMLLWGLVGGKSSEEAVPLKASRGRPRSDTSSVAASTALGAHPDAWMPSPRRKAGKRMSEVCRGRDSARGPGSVMSRPTSRQSTCSVRSRPLSAGGQRSQRGVPARAAGEQLFVVSLETLVMNSEWGSFNLVDPTSDMQMRVSMVKGPNDTRCLRVFKGQSVQEPSIELRPAQMGGSPGDPADGNLEICGPNGEVLGALNLQSTGSFVVTARGKPQLLIEGSDSSDLDLRICLPGGKLAATVACDDGPNTEAASVEFRIFPGSDSMLIVGTVMAVLLLCFDDDQ